MCGLSRVPWHHRKDGIHRRRRLLVHRGEEVRGGHSVFDVRGHSRAYADAGIERVQIWLALSTIAGVEALALILASLNGIE